MSRDDGAAIFLPTDRELVLMHLRDRAPMMAIDMVRRLGLHCRRGAVSDTMFELMTMAKRGWVHQLTTGGADATLSAWELTEAGHVELDRLRATRRLKNFPAGHLTLVKPEPAPTPKPSHRAGDYITCETAAQLAGMTRKAFDVATRRAGLAVTPSPEGASLERVEFMKWWERRVEGVAPATEDQRGVDRLIPKRRKRRAARTRRVELAPAVEQTTPAVVEAVELQQRVERLQARLAHLRRKEHQCRNPSEERADHTRREPAAAARPDGASSSREPMARTAPEGSAPTISPLAS